MLSVIVLTEVFLFSDQYVVGYSLTTVTSEEDFIGDFQLYLLWWT